MTKSGKIKKHHPVRWILISTFCLLIVAPIGFIFGAFYDPSTKTLPDTYDKFDSNISSVVAKSFSKLSTTNTKFSMTLDNDFTDSILVAAFNSIASNPTASKFIKKIYCNMDGDKTTFYVDLQLSFFKTRASIQTKLITEERNGVLTYVFKIENICLGRLPLGNLAKSILPRFITEEQISQAISQIGLHANFSLTNMEITYPQPILKEDLGTILTNYGIRTDTPIGNIILNLFDSLSPKVNYDSGICFEIDFANMNKPAVKVKHGIYDASKLDEDETKFRKFCEDSLNSGYIVASTDKEKGITNSVENLYKFLLTGENTHVEALFKNKTEFQESFKKEFEVDYTSYTGQSTLYNNICNDLGAEIIKTKDPESKYAKSVFNSNIKELDSIKTFFKNSGYEQQKYEELTLCSIGDNLLSDYFRSTDIVGYTFPIAIQTEENKYSVSIMSLDDISTNIADKELDIIINLNFNGIDIPVTIKTTIEDSTKDANRTLKLSPSSIWFGTLDTGTLMNNMLKFMFDSMGTSEIFNLKYDGTNYWFEVSINKIDFGTLGDYDALLKCILSGTGTYDLHNIISTLPTGTTIDASLIDLKIEEIDTDKDVSTLKFTFVNKNKNIEIPS